MLRKLSRYMLVMLGVGLLAGQALANPAIGTNDILDNETGGELYIPFQPSHSGTLGDLIGGGPDRVGMQSDSIQLWLLNPSSSGSVTFELEFDISADLGLFPEIDRNSMELLLTFDDIDFKTDVYSFYTLNEILTLEFKADPGGPTSGTPLTIDESNYHVYSGMAPGHPTDNVVVTYEINLKDDLGIAEADFLDMEADKDFALQVTFEALLNRTFDAPFVTNSSESIGNSFVVTGIPEPATLVMMGLGSLVLIRRRRNR